MIISGLMVMSGLSCCLSEKGVQKVEGMIKDFMGIDVNDGGDVRSWIVGAQKTGNKDGEEALVKTRDLYQLSYERAGDKAYQEGRQDEAIKNYEKALTYTQEAPVVRGMLDTVQSGLELFGIKSIKPTVSNPDPNERNPDLYTKIGRAYNKKGEDLRRSDTPTSAEMIKQFRSAADNYKKGARAASDNKEKSWLYVNAAYAAWNASNSTEALALVDQALKLNPQDDLCINCKKLLMGEPITH